MIEVAVAVVVVVVVVVGHKDVLDIIDGDDLNNGQRVCWTLVVVLIKGCVACCVLCVSSRVVEWHYHHLSSTSVDGI